MVMKCVNVCRFVNHERSKKHKENVAFIRQQMQDDDDELGMNEDDLGLREDDAEIDVESSSSKPK